MVEVSASGSDPWQAYLDKIPGRWSTLEHVNPKVYRMRYLPDEFPAPPIHQGGWVYVDGGGLSQPILVRLAIESGRTKVVGVLVDNDEEIPAQLLRSIRTGQLIEDFVADFDPAGPDFTDVKPKYHELVREEWSRMRDLLVEIPAAGEQPAPARRGRPPTDDALRAFASVFKRNRALTPQRAITRTARETHMARTTVYRWIELCRERGYIEGDQS